ncbi:hypothetical protein ACFYOI_35650 [Streptomyces microflavus]|uniref:hypothetical protein n=1 Tax=Streptomyces microflavus TaxID=1919 RepID=UPI0033A7C090
MREDTAISAAPALQEVFAEQDGRAGTDAEPGEVGEVITRHVASPSVQSAKDKFRQVRLLEYEPS